jgi:hypothetical protein
LLRGGVRLVGFREKLTSEQHSTFYVYVQQLVVDGDVRAAMQHGVEQWIHRNSNVPYEQRLYSLLVAQLHWMLCCCTSSCRLSQENTDSLFCSEMVADCYRAMGLLEARTNVSLILPVDFMLCRVPLINHARLADDGFYLDIRPPPPRVTTTADQLDALERGTNTPPPRLVMK